MSQNESRILTPSERRAFRRERRILGWAIVLVILGGTIGLMVFGLLQSNLAPESLFSDPMVRPVTELDLRRMV